MVMSTERPLHVQVAEVLGYGECSPCGEEGAWHFAPGNGAAYREDFTPTWRDVFDYGEWHRCEHDRNLVPRFDTDWSATGPLIEKYGLTITPEWLMTEPKKLDGWMARAPTFHEAWYGRHPLEAICNVIVALAAAGKLKAA